MSNTPCLDRVSPIFDPPLELGRVSLAPEFTPWMDNPETGQLSCFDSRPDIPAELPNFCSIVRARQLTIRKWCHGEIRVSLTPRYQGSGNQTVSNSGYYPPGIIEVVTGNEQAEKASKRKRKNTLVGRRKLGEDGYLIAGYGGRCRKTILTRNAARSLEEAGEIARRHTGKLGVFLTGTLAGSTAVSLQAIADYSAALVERIRKWIGFHVRARAHVFMAWEPQKRGALHIHCCVCSTDIGGLEYLVAEFQRYWRKLFLDLSSETGIDMFAKSEKKTWIDDVSKPRCDAGFLRSNPARYLSKYVGKEARHDQGKAVYYPSSWISVDSKTKKEAAAERVRITLGGVSPVIAKRLFENLVDLADPLARNLWYYLNPVFAEDKTWIIELEPEQLPDYWYLLQACVDCHLAA